MSFVKLHYSEMIPGERCAIGESPLWSETEQRLYFVDIHGRKLIRFDPLSGTQEIFSTPEMPGNMAPLSAGGVVIAMQSAVWTFDPHSHQFSKVQETPFVPEGFRFNDGISDARGRMIGGTMGLADDRGFDGVLYSLVPDQPARVLMEGFHTINGLALSIDQETLYFADSCVDVARVWKCAYDLETGQVGEREVFIDMHRFKARPDGACIDSNDGYWVAAHEIGEVMRFDALGNLTDRLHIGPRRVGKPAFGGQALDQMFVTTLSLRDEDDPRSGHLFQANVGAQGVTTCAWDHPPAP